MHPNKAFIYQTEQIRELEQLAQERFGITEHVMMQRAGKAALDYLMRRWPHAQQIAIFCGTGNNGGDGYVLAQNAALRGFKITIWQIGHPDRFKNEAKAAYTACAEMGIPIKLFNEHAEIGSVDLIVDAICGIGLKDDLRNEVIVALDKIHSLSAPVLALDVPTGINADTGQVLGYAARAQATITFIGLKLGLLTGSGIAYSGEVVLSDLQLPLELYNFVEPVAEKIALTSFATYLKPRSRDWHKGLAGHVLVVGGDYGFSGAVRMAAEAALRVGAGLVTVATRKEHAYCLNLSRPEIMCRGIEDASELNDLIANADIVVLGPGLGRSEWSQRLWQTVCSKEIPLLLDADALNLLSESDKTNEDWILTPHPGEASRLLHETTSYVQQDRLSALKLISKRYGGTCVLKGAGTLVSSPNSMPALCDRGNPGMATAGMGDILSGVIGGLVAQGIPLGEAAKLGVCLHAVAGDLAAKEGERGMIATDLLPYIRRLNN